VGQIKITSWNIEKLDGVLRPTSSASTQQRRAKRLAAIAQQIHEMAPDVLCVVEGPTPAYIDTFTQDVLGGEYVAIKAADGEYGIRGTQWIWFLVKPDLAPSCELLPVQVWDTFTAPSWQVHYWGKFESEQHEHYRHPQVLVLDWQGQRVELIGLHLKSKIVSTSQQQMWEKGGEDRQQYIEEAIKARIKLATEAQNVRDYIDAKFNQVANPAIFCMGDLNDGPGKEYFEQQYLFFDLLSNIQGDVFFARRFLNHALFDYDQHLRWSVMFEDFVDPTRDPKILLDHILFTQGLTDGSLPLEVKPEAGYIEHEITELINSQNYQYARTSDHRPVSVIVTTA
jgi:endonuclease/exonuclease/phosphatase family metal-dependent hydrolase